MIQIYYCTNILGQFKSTQMTQLMETNPLELDYSDLAMYQVSS